MNSTLEIYDFSEEDVGALKRKQGQTVHRTEVMDKSDKRKNILTEFMSLWVNLWVTLRDIHKGHKNVNFV